MKGETDNLKRIHDDLMAGDVRDYLLENPTFLADNFDLLEKLVPPSEINPADTVQDFQHYMVQRLQENLGSIRGENDNLMDLLQEHLQRQNRINAVMLALLDAKSFEETIDLVANNFRMMLDQEEVSLFIEAGPAFPHGEYGGAMVVPLGFCDEWLGTDRDVLLRETVDASPVLYGTAAPYIGSESLVRLTIDEGVPPGMLAMGHRDPMYYATGLATEQIEFLGSLLERSIRKWLH